MAVQLTLVVPGLLASPAESLAAARSLSTLASCAAAPRLEPRGTAAALFASLGIPDTTPVAPLALRGAGGDPGDDYILCAAPVNLVADRDTVVLVQTIDDLSGRDSDTLVQMLGHHFADDDLRFDALRPDAWFARRREATSVVTTPPDIAGGHRLLASMPRGPDAGRWKRWQNEIEMLLHEHAINKAREARAEPVVSGVWFWGGGRQTDVGPMPTTVVAGSQGRLWDLARGIARCGKYSEITATDAPTTLSQTLARAAALAASNGGGLIRAIVVLPASGGDAATMERDWLAPALDSLAHRRIGILHVIADGHGAAATWIAPAPTWWQRIAVRRTRRPFVVPEAARG